MSLNVFLNTVLETYLSESGNDFKENVLGTYFRKDIVHYIKNLLGNSEHFLVQGSVGKGVWAKIPWVAIFDRFITETAQKGIYIVYLFKEDMTGAYISLNQGVTVFKKHYKSKADEAILIKANDYRSQLNYTSSLFSQNTINLSVKSKVNIGYLYQNGSILSKYYEKGKIPDEKELINDLRYLVNIYGGLTQTQINIANEYVHDTEDDYLGIEDTTKMNIHKMIERNTALARKVKEIQGYKCKICGFEYKSKYKAIGDTYIEAHHLRPLSELGNESKIKLSAKNDFTVLCSNCHRMIHLTDNVHDIEEFKRKYLK